MRFNNHNASIVDRSAIHGSNRGAISDNPAPIFCPLQKAKNDVTRRRVLQTAGSVVAAAWLSLKQPLVLADDAVLDDSIETLYVPDSVDIGVRQAIDFLVDQQNDEGAIVERKHPVTMSSLAIMAMASIGIQPGDDSKFGRSMSRAIDFVLKPGHQTKEGYFGQDDASRMYGQGITTLMLTEMLGMGINQNQNQRIYEALVPAIELILAAQRVPKPQRFRGGWRYEPTSPDSDLSVSVWQVMALRSAKNDSLRVPKQAIDSAIDFLYSSYAKPESLVPAVAGGAATDDGGKVPEPSGFTYIPGTRQSTFTMTSAGLLAIQVCGLYDSPMVVGAAEWLLQNPPKIDERYFFYGIYYYAQGMFQAGGKYATISEALTAKTLLESQKTNGSWLGGGDEKNVGAVYATSLAVLSLSVRYHYLPIYQR